MAETLLKRAHIGFNRALGENEVRELFVYLSRRLSSQIQYTVKRNEHVGDNFISIPHNYPILTSIGIGGAICTGGKYREHNCMMAHFSCFTNFPNRERNKVNGIDFFVAPDYEIVELFEDTRKLTNEFSGILAERED